MVKRILAAFAVLTLSGCALLTAEEPLLIGADEGGFAAREGLWAMRDPETCKLVPAKTDPAAQTCIAWARIQRAQEGGGWSMDSVPPDEKGPYLVRVTMADGDHFLAESVRGDEIVYLLLSPGKGVWNPPFRRLHVQVIACEDVLEDDVPPEGIDVVTDTKDGSITGCTVHSRGGAIEAAQRALRAHPDLKAQTPIEFVRP